MNHFEKITASPDVLAAFLSSLEMMGGPWDGAFQQAFCCRCPEEDCDGPCGCPHQAVRENLIPWWLDQEVKKG